MKSILSTKKLSRSQKQLFLNAGLGLVEYSAIRTETTGFNLPARSIKNAIFTSKNAVKAVLGRTKVRNCFCVGEKTTALLKKNGFHIQETASYGKDLAEIIREKYATEDFIFFCGNRRKEDIPAILKQNKIVFKEFIVYRTAINPKFFPQEFDGILFFSPSAVASFTAKNKLKDTPVFCIGKTTAAEIKKHTNNIKIATKPSIENVIVQVVKYFK